MLAKDSRRRMPFDKGARLIIVHQRTTQKPIPYADEPKDDAAVLVLRIMNV
jgi:hypothetical protein